MRLILVKGNNFSLTSHSKASGGCSSLSERLHLAYVLATWQTIDRQKRNLNLFQVVSHKSCFNIFLNLAFLRAAKWHFLKDGVLFKGDLLAELIFLFHIKATRQRVSSLERKGAFQNRTVSEGF